MLCLTVRNWSVAQNIWRYRRGDAYTDVVLTSLRCILFPVFCKLLWACNFLFSCVSGTWDKQIMCRCGQLLSTARVLVNSPLMDALRSTVQTLCAVCFTHMTSRGRDTTSISVYLRLYLLVYSFRRLLSYLFLCFLYFYFFLNVLTCSCIRRLLILFVVGFHHFIGHARP